MPLSKILPISALLSTALTLAALEPPLVQVLPASFPGCTAAAATPAPVAKVDATLLPVLNEYGLTQSATATYQCGSNSLSVRGYHFNDATGAYGAFTFFRQPAMHAEKIGRDAAVAGTHHLFWTGTTVVDATFTRPSPDESDAIASLASQIPQVHGAAGVPPSLPHYLPTAQLDPATVRYAIGPAAWAGMGGKLPASTIDFGQDTEAVTAQYGPPGAQTTLTLLLYPTPQIAGAHLKAIDALAKSGGLATKRSGPLLAIVNGNTPTARQLLGAVQFNDYVTINHPEGYVPETVKLYRLLMGITMLVVILICAALILGLFFGGGRALIRMLRGKPVSAVTEEEFISLHLGG
jgi:hypothetical protein